MLKVSFDEACRKMDCENYIEWDYQETLSSGPTRYLSDIVCVSCTKMGQSFNIEEYPVDCPYQAELEQYVAEQDVKYERFLKLQEQEKIWEKLNAIK